MSLVYVEHGARLFQEGVVVTDGLSGECLHMILEGGKDWRTPLQQVFNKKLGSEWCFLVMELCAGNAHFHLLKPETTGITGASECSVLWVVQVITDAPQKPKVTKKVVKKSSAGTKVVRKKASASVTTAATGDEKENNNETVPKKTAPVKIHSVTNGDTTENSGISGETTVESGINGEVSGDSGVSVVDSDNEKSLNNSKTELISDHPSFDRTDTVFVTPHATLSSVPKSQTQVLESDISSDNNEEQTACLTLRLNNTGNPVGYKYESTKMEKITEENGERAKIKDTFGPEKDTATSEVGCNLTNGSSPIISNGTHKVPNTISRMSQLPCSTIRRTPSRTMISRFDSLQRLLLKFTALIAF